jgi:hypothetical protein
MTSTPRYALAATILLLGSAGAWAQPQPAMGPARSPSFSPYLNLLSRGATPAVNYFGIIRPGQQLAQQQTALQQQLAQTNQTLNSAATGAANDTLFTGRGATFGFYSHYFNNSPAAGGGLGGFAGGSRASGGFAGGGGAMSAFGRPNANTGQAPRGGNRPAARGAGGVGGVRR